MKLQKQIKIVRELLDATIELNGEYQTGWERDIEEGEKLLEYLQKKIEKQGDK